MKETEKIALRSEELLFDINYKVQDLNLALLQLTTKIENLNEKEFLRNELLETITQLLKFQIYVDTKRVAIIKIYSLFEKKSTIARVDLGKAKILKKPTNAFKNEK